MASWRAKIGSCYWLWSAVFAFCLPFFFIPAGADGNNFWSNIYFVMPFFGAAVASLRLTRNWSKTDPRFRPVVALFATALALWGVGAVIWIFYNIELRTPIPYPSKAELGFFGATTAWAIAFVVLHHNYRLPFNLSGFGPILTVAAMFPWNVGSYVKGPFQEGPQDIAKVLLDGGYPIVDALGWCMLGGFLFGAVRLQLSHKYRPAFILILVGLVGNYVSDVFFNIFTTLNRYHNGGPIDVGYFLSLSILVLGLIMMPLTESPLQASTNDREPAPFG